VDFAEPFAHLPRRGKGEGDEFRWNALAVDGDRQVAEHTLGIGSFFVV
jgi:hypothetical protein